MNNFVANANVQKWQMPKNSLTKHSESNSESEQINLQVHQAQIDDSVADTDAEGGREHVEFIGGRSEKQMAQSESLGDMPN